LPSSIHILRLLVRESLKYHVLQEDAPLPGSPRAIFMAGCAGSGKDTIVSDMRRAVPALGNFEEINPDFRYEELMRAAELALGPPRMDPEKLEALPPHQAEEFRQKRTAWLSQAAKLQHRALGQVTGGSKGISPQRMGLSPEKYGIKPADEPGPQTELEVHISNRANLIINGTSANYKRISDERKILEDLGYETMMVAVVVPVDTAVDRNRERGEKGERRVPSSAAVAKQCEKLLNYLSNYEADFGNNFIEVDNTLPLGEALLANDIRKIHAFIS